MAAAGCRWKLLDGMAAIGRRWAPWMQLDVIGSCLDAMAAAFGRSWTLVDAMAVVGHG